MLSRLPTTATTSGVRVSCRPRSTPVVASMTRSGVVPRKAIRRYVVGRVRDVRVGAERADQRLGEHDPQDGRDRADQDRQPDPVDPLGQGAAAVTGAEPPGDAGGGAVGEEDAQPDGGLQDHRGDPESGQRCGAEVADDGRVGEQEHRLRDQGQERGDGEPDDLAVLRVHHAEKTTTVMDSDDAVTMT